MRHITLNILFLFILSMPLIGQSSINLLDPSSDPLSHLYDFWVQVEEQDSPLNGIQCEAEWKTPRLFIWLGGFNFFPEGYDVPNSEAQAMYGNRPQAYGAKHYYYMRSEEDAIFGTDTLHIPVQMSWNSPKLTIKVVFESNEVAYFKVGDNPFYKMKRSLSPTFADYLVNMGLNKYSQEKFPFSLDTKIEEYKKIPDAFIEKNGSFFTLFNSISSPDKPRSVEPELAIFPTHINEDQFSWQIEKVWKLDEYLMVFGKGGAYTYPRNPLFIFKPTAQGLKLAVVSRFIPEFSQKSFQPLFSKGNQLVPFEELPEAAFKKYLPKGIFNFLTIFKPIQLSRDKHIRINGAEYRFNRAYRVNETYQAYQASQAGVEDLANNPSFKQMIEFDHVLEFYRGNEIFTMRATLNSDSPKLFCFGGRTIFLPIFQGASNDKWANELQPANKIYLLLLLQFSIILIPIVILAFSIYRMFILPRRLKNRLTRVQFEGVKSQLNPHFLFNSMATIQSLMNQRKIKEANRYISELSDLLRYHLDTGAEELVPLSEELSAIEHYCELEKLRSPFDISFEIDERIDPDRLEIPNQLLQPIIENAIKHGLRKVEDPKLRIRIQQLEKSFSILIEDNGPGIGKQEKVAESLSALRKTHKGLGLVKEKISLLKKRGIKVHLEIEERTDSQGTIVKIELPLDI